MFLVVWEIGSGGYVCRVGQCEQSLGRQRAWDPGQEGVEQGECGYAARRWVGA